MTDKPQTPPPLPSWKELFPEQAHILETANARHHRGQAYLFVGTQERALRAFAMGWAQTAACRTPTPTGAACGTCRNCQLFQGKGRCDYPEIYTLAPTSKAATIKTEETREFNKLMVLTAPTGMIKIALITEAAALQPEAANTLLKTLEEPDDHTLFLLLTTAPHRVLPTIISRCQKMVLATSSYDYAKDPGEDFLKLLSPLHRGAGTRVALAQARKLVEVFKAIQKQAADIVKNRNIADANYRDLLEQVKKDASLKDKIEKLNEGDVFTEYSQQREKYLDTIQSWFRQRYLLASGVPREKLPQQEMLPFMPPETDPKSPLEAEEDMKEIDVFQRALQSKVPEELAFEAMTLTICQIPPRT
jgi:DNA polymerase III delta prime subunit